MKKLQLLNQTEDVPDSTLRNKADLILGSVSAYLPMLEVKLASTSAQESKTQRYVCEILIARDDTNIERIRSSHAQADLALETALLRLRRDIIRRRLRPHLKHSPEQRA